MGVSASEDGTHGASVQIWMNDLAADAIAAGDGADMPEGAILVKEGYGSEDGAANGITVMAKESGWGDDGWFWAKYAGDWKRKRPTGRLRERLHRLPLRRPRQRLVRHLVDPTDTSFPECS